MSQTRNNPQIFGGFLYQQLLTYDNTNRLILDLNRNWSQVWTLLDGINFGKSRGFRDKDGKFYRSKQLRSYPKGTIATATQVGANLLLTLVDSSYTGFQTKHSVRDDSMNDARIINAGVAGQLLIEPGQKTTILTAATHFIAGSNIYGFYDVSGNYDSAGKETIYRTTQIQTDYVSVQRASAKVARREMFNSHLMENGVAYLWSDNERNMVSAAIEDYGLKVMFSEGGVRQSVVEGLINGTRGVRRGLLDDGAAQDISTSPINWQKLTNLIMEVVGIDGDVNQDVVVMIGRSAMQRLQNEKEDFMKYAGINNTIGGKSVIGINFKTWAVAGVTVKFMIAPWMSDARVPYWMQESAWIMDLSPIPGKDASGNMSYESPLMKIHYGDDDDEKIYKCIPGMVGNTPGMKGSPFELYDIAANSFDSCTFEMLMDNGISGIFDKSAIFEYRMGN